MKLSILTIIVGFGLNGVPLNGEFITYQARSNTRPLDNSGSYITDGSLVQLGSFSVGYDPASHVGDNASLRANFTVLGTTTTFTEGAVPRPGSINGLAQVIGIEGKQLYLWIYNGVSPNAATQQGLFTNPLWIAPGDEPPNNSYSFSLSNPSGLQPIVGSTILAGPTLSTTTGQLAAITSTAASLGLHTFTNGVTFSSNTTYGWDFVGNTLAGRGTDYDGLDVNGGNLVIAPGAKLKLTPTGVDFTSPEWDSTRTFSVAGVSGGGTSSGDFTLDESAIGTADDGQGSWSVSNNSGGVTVTWTPTAVPEPSTYVILSGLAALGLCAHRRFRRDVRSQVGRHST